MTEYLKFARRVQNGLVSAGHPSYLVGGGKRDAYLGRTPKDYDIATAATPDEVAAIFPDSELVGAKFGVRLVKGEGFTVEVATFRLDGAYSDCRRPDEVSYTRDVLQDLARRDFTMNALLEDHLGQTHDLIGAIDDLDRRLIRAIGSATKRFQEDALRMMRAIRFACTLDFEIEEETYQAIIKNAHLIVYISQERIREELDQILVSGHADRGFRLMLDTGLLQYIMPEIANMRGVAQPKEWHPEGDVWNHTMRMLSLLPEGCTITLALGVLLHDVGKPAAYREVDGRPKFPGHEETGAVITEGILRRLKYPNEVVETIFRYVAEHMKFMCVEEMRKSRLYRFIRQENFREMLELHKLDCLGSNGELGHARFIEQKLIELPPAAFRPAPLISGRDLINLGLKPGPMFRTILERVETHQLEGNILTVDEALSYASVVAQNLLEEPCQL